MARSVIFAAAALALSSCASSVDGLKLTLKMDEEAGRLQQAGKYHYDEYRQAQIGKGVGNWAYNKVAGKSNSQYWNAYKSDLVNGEHDHKYKDKVEKIAKRNHIDTTSNPKAAQAITDALREGEIAIHDKEHDDHQKWVRVGKLMWYFFLALIIAYFSIVMCNHNEHLPCRSEKVHGWDEDGNHYQTSICLPTWFNDRDDTDGMSIATERTFGTGGALNSIKNESGTAIALGNGSGSQITYDNTTGAVLKYGTA